MHNRMSRNQLCLLLLALVAGGRAWGANEAYPRILATGSTPPGILEQIVEAGEPEDASQVIVFDSTAVRMEPSGLTHRVHHTLTKVLTEEGARELAALRFDFDPASNMIAIRRVRIHHPDSTFHVIDPAGAVDAYAPAWGIYWGARMQVLALPRLLPGDVVEVETYKKGFLIAYLQQIDEDEERFIPPMRGHFYDSVLFGDDVPIVLKHYQLTVPREKVVQYSTYNGEISSALAYTDSTLVYRWWAEDLPAVSHEPRQPDWSDFVPKVVMATVPDWPAKSRWFFEVNDWVFAWNEEIQAKVDELIAGLKDDDEKIAVLTHWVADHIRYSGLSMGKGEGYTIHPSTMTYEERCGVCKDIAGMLVTMLRAAGFTTYPAMTMAGARVEAVPADQFNHCVVALKREDGSFQMLDPTWVPHYRDLWSKAEGEQHYVIGSPEGEDRRAIETFTAEESPLRVKLKMALNRAGNLTGEIELTGEGYMDSRLRGALAYRSRSEWDGYLALLISSIDPGVEITESDYSDPQDYTRTMRIRGRFAAAGYAAVTDSTIDLQVPSLRFLTGSGRFVRLIGLEPMEDRQHPALFWATGMIDLEAELELPDKYRFSGDLPASDLTYPAGFHTATGKRRGRTLSFHHRIGLAQRTVSAEQWADLADVAASVDSLAGIWLHGTR